MGFKRDTVIGKIAGQKSKVSRHYNQLIRQAEASGNTASAAGYKAAKTKQHRQIEKQYA